MGQEGGHGASSHGRPITSQDRYALVPGMGPAIRLGGQIRGGPSQIQRRIIGSTVPVDNRHLQYTENAALWRHGGMMMAKRDQRTLEGWV